MLSVEEVRERLGLRPFDEFYEEGKKLYGDRRLGLTTRMLVNAVHAAQTKNVAIRGHTRHYSRDLARTAQGYAYKLGIDTSRIWPYPHKGVDETYTDHYYPIRR